MPDHPLHPFYMFMQLLQTATNHWSAWEYSLNSRLLPPDMQVPLMFKLA